MTARSELANALRELRFARREYQRILAERRLGDLLEECSRCMSPEELRDTWEATESLVDFWVRERERSQA